MKAVSLLAFTCFATSFAAPSLARAESAFGEATTDTPEKAIVTDESESSGDGVYGRRTLKPGVHPHRFACRVEGAFDVVDPGGMRCSRIRRETHGNFLTFRYLGQVFFKNVHHRMKLGEIADLTQGRACAHGRTSACHHLGYGAADGRAQGDGRVEVVGRQRRRIDLILL